MCNFKKEIIRPDGLPNWASANKRYNPSDKNETRSEFKHDEDEIIYSRAFRRLSHKSQIVVHYEHHDHFRSRLTHTLEVNQIAENIGYRLGLNIALLNSVALGHDIGHCPFGHAGEREFQSLMRREVLQLCDNHKLTKNINEKYSASISGFEEEGKDINNQWLFHHAINSVRIIERKLHSITDETKDGILRHSWGPWQVNPKFGVPNTYEAQAVAIADQVAAINHDTEDILSFPESEHDIKKIREILPDFIKEYGIEYSEVEKIRDKWFLPQ